MKGVWYLTIAGDLIRGHTDAIILAHRDIQKRSQGRYEFKEATLYTAVRRLEQCGCITSYWGDESTGARRRYYAITELGRETYKTLVRDWENARALINKLIYVEGV
jgi:DNA-binding PadR family transcriptional regulator